MLLHATVVVCEARCPDAPPRKPAPRNAAHLRARLAVAAGQHLEAGVDLDAGHDALLLQDVDERRAVGARLEERLVEHDRARDELAEACCVRCVRCVFV